MSEAASGRGTAESQLHAVILAGGRGTRFWPRSRTRRSKQVLSVIGERTLIQQTLDRLAPVCPPERTWIITNQFLRDEILRQLPGVPAAQVIAEPVQRNTAPAIGLAAHLVERAAGPGAVIGVFPADQVIQNDEAFREALASAVCGARVGRIVVLGIRPRWPETGYGYVEFEHVSHQPGARDTVVKFHEKPDAARAAQYIATGRYFWNSGMFVWSADTILRALQRFLPATAGALDEMARDFSPQTLARLYPQCENISIDYAVMEKAAAESMVQAIACDIGWNDVGSWNAVYELLPRDAEGNALRGDVYAADSRNNYIDGAGVTGKLIAAVGVDDLVIVDTPDALLITRRERAQDVSQVVKWLEKNKRDKLL